MNTVLVRGSYVAAVIYVLTGFFGYLTFANNPEVLNSKHILNAPYGNNIAINIGRVA